MAPMSFGLPVHLSIRLEDTPWQSDPTCAGDFYRSLGVAIVAWGRLEGHVVATLMQVRQLPGTTILPGEFPVSWRRKAKTWRRAFREMPILSNLRGHAEQIMTEIMNEIQTRHFLSHTMWREITDAPEMSANAVTMKPEDADASDNAILSEMRVTIGDLALTTAAANRLNYELGFVSAPIADLRPTPPGARII